MGRVLQQIPPGGILRGVITDIKKRALHRSKILAGQLRGLEKMIDNEDYCMDIITQSLAIQKSLQSLNKLLVENHLRTHVSEMFAAGGEQQELAIDELLKVYELNNNRAGEKR
jgi:DNA-binding FrmR family transcriptional regulator